MLEILVLFLCVKDYACNNATTQYYKTNENLQEQVKLSKRKIENRIGKEASVSAGVLILGAADRKIKARVTKNFFIVYDSQEIRGDLKWEF